MDSLYSILPDQSPAVPFEIKQALGANARVVIVRVVIVFVALCQCVTVMTVKEDVSAFGALPAEGAHAALRQLAT